MKKSELRRIIRESIRETIKEDVTGCEGGECTMTVVEDSTGKTVWEKSVGCTSGCKCSGMTGFDCGSGAKTVPINGSIKNLLRKNGYKKSFEGAKLIINRGKKRKKIKEDMLGCSGTCTLKVNGEVVTKVNCEASRGTCECGGVEGAGCGGGKETPVVNLSYKMYREFINK